MPVSVPDTASPGEGGHITDHNLIATDLATLSTGLDDITGRMPPGRITVSDTEPTSPAEGDLWFDTSGAA